MSKDGPLGLTPEIFYRKNQFSLRKFQPLKFCIMHLAFSYDYREL